MEATGAPSHTLCKIGTCGTIEETSSRRGADSKIPEKSSSPTFFNERDDSQILA